MLLSTHGILSRSFEEAIPFSNAKSLEFDGIVDYVDMGNVLDFEKTDDFSLSYWFKVSSASSFYVVLGKSLTSGAGYMVWNQSSKVNFRIRSSSGGQLRITSNTSIIADTWTHCVITYDGSSLNSGLEMYINGVLESSALKQGSMDSSSTLTTSNFNISGRNNGNSLFNGSIDEASVFDSELSQSDITSIYGGGVPSSLSGYSSLISWWRCGDSDTAPTLTDNKGSNDGTMNGMTSANIVSDVPPTAFESTKSVEMDGISDYMSLSSRTQNFTDFTVSFWIRANNLSGSNYDGIFGQDSTTNEGGIMRYVVVSGDKVQAYIGSWVPLSVDLTASTWTNIIITNDSSTTTLKGYTNGVLSYTYDTSSYSVSTTNAHSFTRIGMRNGSSSSCLACNLDEFAVWDSVKNISDIYDSSTSLKDFTSTSPVHWWRMGEGLDSSSTVYDTGSGSIDLTLNGFNTYSTDTP